MPFRSTFCALLLLLAGCNPLAEQSRSSDTEQVLQDPRRVVELEGGRNVRDLGGYRTSDGHRVKWGVLYRSGSPAHWTQNDFRKLDGLGIRMVCDLRSTKERETEPNRWASKRNVSLWSRDYSLETARVAAALQSASGTPALMRDAMLADYRAMPEVQADSFKALFRNLAQGNVPLMVNCSAGKDRTGLASALVLASLGVPLHMVVKDYALSDKLVDYRAELAKDAATNATAAKLVAMPAERLAPMLRSDPAYIEAAFGAIRRQYGSIDAYLERRLGVTPAMRLAMRASLLEPAK